ncbi:MAG TPA: hypothetical protein DCX54_01385 [Flavobacteriales bacterium]|nr:hypothetical protein [Flavobacteriales bacterium]
MNNKLFLFVSVLVASLLGLMLMLIYWGNKSVELRESLFIDQVNIAVDQMVSDLEEDYYCFDLHASIALPKLDSFYIANPPGISDTDKRNLELTYITSEGQKKTFTRMPLMGPSHMQMLLRFEFDDIPKFKEDSSLSNFEMFVRNSYEPYVTDGNGIRLIDTTRFDSLLTACVTRLYPEAILNYTVSLKDENKVIYANNHSGLDTELNPDVRSSIYKNDSNIPELLLLLEVINKRDMFSGEAWNIYLSAVLLAIISIVLIFYLTRIQIQQRNLLKIQKDFVHGITHEFNTPISNIKLVAQSLLKSEDEKLKKSGSILQEEGNKLQTGINLVLTTALIEKNELLLQKENIDLKELIRKTAERNKSLLSRSGIDLDLKLDPNELYTKGDIFHLENVFQNLITNVKKHSGANLLCIESEQSNGHLTIRSSDNGKGIDLPDRKKIFEKFERRKSKGAKNGYGLGLYYSRMILELHGGQIELSDFNQIGSVFSIRLPA